MNSIKKSLFSGIFYTALAKYSGVLINIIIGAILARLLSPDEFGIVAIILVFVTFFNLLADFGIGPAIIQHQEISNNDIKSIFSFTLIIGFVLAGLFYLSSGLISRFYKEPALINVSRLLSVSVLFFSLQIIPYSLAQKSLKFKTIGLITLIIQIFSGTIAIILAYKGYSYFSLVFKSVVTSILTFIAFYVATPVKISFSISYSSLKKISRFSSYQFLFNFINYFSRNADKLLIGKFLNTEALGFYDKSYQLMMLPVQNLTHVITPVLMPVLAKHQDNKILIYNNYIKIVKLLALIGFPLSVLLTFSSTEIIYTLFGQQWQNSIPVFKILAFTIGIQMILSSSGAIFQTVNRTDLLFYSGIISSIFTLTGICYGIFFGKSLISIGYGILLAFYFNFFQGFYFLIHVALEISYRKFLRELIFPLFVGISIIPFMLLVDQININSMLLSLILKTLICIIITSILLLIFPKKRIEIIGIIKNKK